MEYLFDRWPAIERALKREIFLLSDYDGTLTPIVDEPSRAFLSEGMRELLKSVSEKISVGIISGRSLPDIKNLVGISGVYYAANHGFEIEGPGLSFSHPKAELARPIAKEICGQLETVLSRVRGAIVEDKGVTASVHYRMVAEADFAEFKRVFDEVVNPSLKTGEIRVTEGKKVLEIRPNIDWDKGKASVWMLDSLRVPKKVLTIYLGDDRTDEDAFRALEEKGITILISQRLRKSNAKFFLKDVNEVGKFLKRLVGIKRRTSKFG